MVKKEITYEEIKNILQVNDISATIIKKFTKSGQKQVFEIKINEVNYILKIFDITPYSIHNQFYIDKDEVTISKSQLIEEQIQLILTRIHRELAISKLCPIFPKLIILDSAQRFKIDDYHFLFYIEEKVQGLNFAEALQTQHFSIHEVIDFIEQATNLIKKMNLCKIVHRDIKPLNIIYHEGKYHFIDAGLGKILDEDYLEQYKITYTGFRMGSPRYLPPEQERILSNYVWDFRTDLFPIGLIAIEMFLPKLRFASRDDLRDLHYVRDFWIKKDDSHISKLIFHKLIVNLSSIHIGRRFNNLNEIFNLIQEIKLEGNL